jgi:hypothetical protein
MTLKNCKKGDYVTLTIGEAHGISVVLLEDPSPLTNSVRVSRTDISHQGSVSQDLEVLVMTRAFSLGGAVDQ